MLYDMNVVTPASHIEFSNRAVLISIHFEFSATISVKVLEQHQSVFPHLRSPIELNRLSMTYIKIKARCIHKTSLTDLS